MQRRNYSIIRCIHKGVTGDIFLAREFEKNDKIILKIFSSEFSSDSAFINHFVKNAKNLFQLKHKQIAKLHNYGQFNQQLCYISEYIKGRSIKDIKFPVGEKQSLNFIVQTTKVLRYLYSLGILHTRLSPSNLIINHDQIVKFTNNDLGIAKAFNKRWSWEFGSGGCKISGVPINDYLGYNICYVSPEHVLQEQLDQRSVIYSLGTIWVYLLTLKPRFVGNEPLDIFSQILDQEVISLLGKNIELSKKNKKIINIMTEKNKKNRYQTFDELLNDLCS